MARASCGCSSRNSSSRAATAESTTPLTSEDPNLSLVCGESRPRGVARGFNFFFLGGEFLLDIVVQRARKRRPIAGEMRATVLLRNVIGVAIHALLVGVVPLHSDFHLRVAVARLKPQHRGMHRRLAAIQVSDEGL